MKKLLTTVSLGVAFLIGTSYAQEPHWQTGPEVSSGSFQSSYGEIQTGGSYNTAPMAIAPAHPALPRTVVELPSNAKVNLAVPYQVQSGTFTGVEKYSVKSPVETGRELYLKSESSIRPLTNAVRTEGKFEIEGNRNSAFLQSTRKRQAANQGSSDGASFESLNQTASPAVRKLIKLRTTEPETTVEITEAVEGQPNLVQTQIVTPLVQQNSEPADVETEVPAALTQDLLTETKLSSEAAQALIQSPQVLQNTPQTQEGSSNTSGFTSDELDFGLLQTPAETSVEQTSSQIATPLVQRDTETSNVETQIQSVEPQDLPTKTELRSGTLIQSRQQTTKTQGDSSNTSGFTSDELDFDESPTSVRQTRKKAVARGSVLPKVGTAAKKSVRAVKRRRKKIAAGAWRANLPLLLLPVLCWYVWRLFGKRKREQEEVIPVSEEQQSADVSVSSKVTTAATFEEEVSSGNSLDVKTPTSGLEYGSEATTQAVTNSEKHKKPVAENESQEAESAKTATDIGLKFTTLKSSGDQKSVADSSGNRQTITGSPTTEPVDANEQHSSSKSISAKSTSSVISFSGESKRVEADGVQSGDNFIVSGTPKSKLAVSSVSPIKTNSAVKSESVEVDAVKLAAVSSTAANAASAEMEGMAHAAQDDPSKATEVKGLNATCGLAGGNSESSSKRFCAKSDGDDLTQIAGITKEAQQVLCEAGYHSFSDIQKSNVEDLKKVFAKGNYRFTSADFKTWSSQAAVHRAEQCVVQNNHQSGKNTIDSSAGGDAWTEKATVISESLETYSNQVGDDLTKINGIGPATASLLGQSGITTFRGLREAGTDRLGRDFGQGRVEFSIG